MVKIFAVAPIKFPELPFCELYLSGGCVRDHLLNIPYHDKDFVIITRKSFLEVIDLINSMPDSKVYLAKPEFMTIRCRIQGQDVDITWPRVEKGYSDFRHPDRIILATSLEEDAIRRDFTINAMYLDKDGMVFDFLGGQDDLRNKVLRTCSDPGETFHDDYLRIVRMIRFSVKYDLSTENDVFQSAYQSVYRLVEVPFERTRDELNKALLINPAKTFEWIDSLQMFPILSSLGLSFQLTAKDLK